MIHIVIPVFNRKEYTLACLHTLTKQQFSEPYEVVVVDDGSTDGTSDDICRLFPKVKVVKGTGNWWWTKSINMGIRAIWDQIKANDYILIINNDLEVNDNYIETLLRTSLEHERALVGSLSVNYYNEQIIQDAGVMADWNKFAFIKLRTTGGKTFNEKVDALPGRGTLIPVEVFKKIGFFNEFWLPHYAADYDFAIRAKKAGFKLVVSYRAIVRSKDKPGEKQFSFWKYNFSRRSSANIPAKISLAVLDAPSFYLIIKSLATILGRFIRDLFVMLYRKR